MKFKVLLSTLCLILGLLSFSCFATAPFADLPSGPSAMPDRQTFINVFGGSITEDMTKIIVYTKRNSADELHALLFTGTETALLNNINGSYLLQLQGNGNLAHLYWTGSSWINLGYQYTTNGIAVSMDNTNFSQYMYSESDMTSLSTFKTAFLGRTHYMNFDLNFDSSSQYFASESLYSTVPPVSPNTINSTVLLSSDSTFATVSATVENPQRPVGVSILVEPQLKYALVNPNDPVGDTYKAYLYKNLGDNVIVSSNSPVYLACFYGNIRASETVAVINGVLPSDIPFSLLVGYKTNNIAEVQICQKQIDSEVHFDYYYNLYDLQHNILQSNIKTTSITRIISLQNPTPNQENGFIIDIWATLEGTTTTNGTLSCSSTIRFNSSTPNEIQNLGTGNTAIVSNWDKPVSPTLPENPTIFDYVGYGVDYFIYIFKLIFYYLATLFVTLINGVTMIINQMAGFTVLLTSCFNFIPAELKTLLGIAMAGAILVFFIKK